MHQIDITDASKELAAWIEVAISGEEVVIMKNNQPAVKLVSLTTEPQKKTRKAGSAKGLIWMADDFDEPLEDFREYME